MRSSAAAEQFSNRGEKNNQEDPASRNKEMEDLSLTMSQSVLGAFGLRGPGEKRNDEKPSTQKDDTNDKVTASVLAAMGKAAHKGEGDGASTNSKATNLIGSIASRVKDMVWRDMFGGSRQNAKLGEASASTDKIQKDDKKKRSRSVSRGATRSRSRKRRRSRSRRKLKKRATDTTEGGPSVRTSSPSTQTRRRRRDKKQKMSKESRRNESKSKDRVKERSPQPRSDGKHRHRYESRARKSDDRRSKSKERRSKSKERRYKSKERRSKSKERGSPGTPGPEEEGGLPVKAPASKPSTDGSHGRPGEGTPQICKKVAKFKKFVRIDGDWPTIDEHTTDTKVQEMLERVASFMMKQELNTILGKLGLPRSQGTKILKVTAVWNYSGTE